MVSLHDYFDGCFFMQVQTPGTSYSLLAGRADGVFRINEYSFIIDS
ncbi:hypothetical protein KFV02_02015 [Desulfohalobiaceae bacterium Ax17]|nr:hypothetical protein [Desulfovulcanus ferrireducens]MBT8762705.1 hypothetical protein [Desulfovulcanus ferrireducens]